DRFSKAKRALQLTVEEDLLPRQIRGEAERSASWTFDHSATTVILELDVHSFLLRKQVELVLKRAAIGRGIVVSAGGRPVSGVELALVRRRVHAVARRRAGSRDRRRPARAPLHHAHALRLHGPRALRPLPDR